MKIDLPVEEDGFIITPVDFVGVPALLINPAASAKWNKHNLHLRSIIINRETNEILSTGWPKFMNFGEKPDSYPSPSMFTDWKIQEKTDGTLVIVDFFNDQINLRTRGTPSYKTQNNSADFELLLIKYPAIVDFLKQNQTLSLLFEMVTPNNVIVIREEEVRFYFIGAIDKTDLSVKVVDNFLNSIKPKEYTFSSLDEISKSVKQWKGLEGVVLAYNNNQNRVKFKSDWYLWIHRVKSQLNSENNLIELYVNKELPGYEDFYKIIEDDYDYEVALQLKSEIKKLCEVGINVKFVISSMKNFVTSIRNLPSRKDQANSIKESYGAIDSSRMGMLFTLLDGKELNNVQVTTLIKQLKCL